MEIRLGRVGRLQMMKSESEALELVVWEAGSLSR